MAHTHSPSLESLSVLKYFDDTTMSVHLRDRSVPRAKKGTPGEMKIVALSETPLTEFEVDQMAREIVTMAGEHPEGFIEAEGGGSTVVQLANLRIAIARPPFSDAVDITVVRPVAHLKLADYSFEATLRERFAARHRGVLVSGAPGAGKSTFVSAIADALETASWNIKTMERPRDLVVSDEITQYTALKGDMANTADVLLLVRPDYTIFDELRRTDDFHVFADLRMAGVGMIGVVHATRAIDALQRMVGRVELGMIPQVVDTVVYVDGGDVKQIYDVSLTVKMPSGLGDEGLARPVIEVKDVESGRLVFEMYSFADQVVVMPIGGKERTKPVWEWAARALEAELGRLIRGPIQVQVVSDNSIILLVDEEVLPAVIGRGGENVHDLEAHIGLSIKVRAVQEQEDAGSHFFGGAERQRASDKRGGGRGRPSDARGGGGSQGNPKRGRRGR